MPEIVAHAPDGTELHFPDGTPDEVIQRTVKGHIASVMAPPPPVDQRAKNASMMQQTNGGLNQQAPSNYLLGNPKTPGEGVNNTIDILRNILPPAAGAGAGILATPYTGGLGTAAASGAAYTGVDALLKQLKIGNKETIPESLKDSLIQAAINEAGGKVISGVWKGFKGVVKPAQEEFLKYLPTAAQALKQSGEHPTVAKILKVAEDYFAPGSKAAAQERSAAAGAAIGDKLSAKTAGRSVGTVTNPNDMVSLINDELGPNVSAIGSMNKTAPYFTNPQEFDEFLKKPELVQKALTKAQASGMGINAKQDLAGLRLSRIQQAATEVQPDGGVRLNTQKLFSQMDDPEMASTNKILFGSSKGPSNIRQFYKNAAETQVKSGSFGGFGKLRMLAEGVSLAGGLGRAMITGNALPLAVGALPVAVELGTAAIAKGLTSEKTARLLLSLANDEALGVSDKYAARILMQTLTNATGNLVNKDGSKTPFVVKGGQMVPLQ